jgi:hypothetical protein
LLYYSFFHAGPAAAKIVKAALYCQDSDKIGACQRLGGRRTGASGFNAQGAQLRFQPFDLRMFLLGALTF